MPAHIDLFAHVTLIAVGCIHGAVSPRAITRAHGGAHRLFGFGVELHGGVKSPHRPGVERGPEQHIAEPVINRGAPRQGDVLVLETQALCDAETRGLCTCRGVDQAGGDPQRQQVAVRDAVIADKGVLGINGGKAEVMRARVVVGQQALVAVGGVDVKGPGLKRLDKTGAEIAGFTFKHQAAIETERGGHAAGRAGPGTQRCFKLVIGGVQLDFGGDEPGRCNPGPTHLHQGEHPLGIGLPRQHAIGLETGEVSIHRVIKPVDIDTGIARGQLRQAVVRRCDGRREVLQGLPLERAHAA